MYVFAFFRYSLQTCILANIRICKGNYFEKLLNYLYVRRIKQQIFISQRSYTDDYNSISFISTVGLTVSVRLRSC